MSKAKKQCQFSMQMCVYCLQPCGVSHIHHVWASSPYHSFCSRPRLARTGSPSPCATLTCGDDPVTTRLSQPQLCTPDLILAWNAVPSAFLEPPIPPMAIHPRSHPHPPPSAPRLSDHCHHTFALCSVSPALLSPPSPHRHPQHSPLVHPPPPPQTVFPHA